RLHSRNLLVKIQIIRLDRQVTDLVASYVINVLIIVKIKLKLYLYTRLVGLFAIRITDQLLDIPVLSLWDLKKSYLDSITKVYVILLGSLSVNLPLQRIWCKMRLLHSLRKSGVWMNLKILCAIISSQQFDFLV